MGFGGVNQSIGGSRHLSERMIKSIRGEKCVLRDGEMWKRGEVDIVLEVHCDCALFPRRLTNAVDFWRLKFGHVIWR